MNQHFTPDQFETDIAFLVRRDSLRNQCIQDAQRETGLSADGLIQLAYTGTPITRVPGDRSDLAACERAVAKLPDHRRTREVEDQLQCFRDLIEAKYAQAATQDTARVKIIKPIDYSKRPIKTDCFVINCAAKLALDPIKEWFEYYWPLVNLENLEADLKAIFKNQNYNDGRKLSAALSQHLGSKDHQALEDIFDKDFLSKALTACEADWVKLRGIVPQFSVGDPVSEETCKALKINLLGGDSLGTITQVDGKTGRYQIGVQRVGYMTHFNFPCEEVEALSHAKFVGVTTIQKAGEAA